MFLEYVCADQGGGVLLAAVPAIAAVCASYDRTLGRYMSRVLKQVRSRSVLLLILGSSAGLNCAPNSAPSAGGRARSHSYGHNLVVLL